MNLEKNAWKLNCNDCWWHRNAEQLLWIVNSPWWQAFHPVLECGSVEQLQYKYLLLNYFTWHFVRTVLFEARSLDSVLTHYPFVGEPGTLNGKHINWVAVFACAMAKSSPLTIHQSLMYLPLSLQQQFQGVTAAFVFSVFIFLPSFVGFLSAWMHRGFAVHGPFLWERTWGAVL